MFRDDASLASSNPSVWRKQTLNPSRGGGAVVAAAGVGYMSHS